MGAAQVLFGEVPPGDGSGSGDGYGYGDGSGSGSGYGYGDGYGSGSGSGYGDGYGSGSGYGDGYGYGSGYGYGYGDGYGYGSGSGSGSGSGYGYGDGYGYGSGSGSGSGDGYGYGDGSKEYWSSLIAHFASKWDGALRTRLEKLQEAGHTIAYWRSDESGKPCNGGDGGAVTAGAVQKIPGPLRLCGSGALHATMTPPAWKGARVWIVALIGKVVWDGDKCGALEREILGECLQ